MTLTTAQTNALIGLPAVSTKRLCGGGRTEGGAYIECNFGDMDIRDFLIDAPRKYSVIDNGMTAVAPNKREIGGEWHLIDVVGESYYPYPADFIEEAARFGVSRKVPLTFDFDKLKPGAMLFLHHTRAFLENPAEVGAHLDQHSKFRCPTGAHGPLDACAGHHWSALKPRVLKGQPALPAGVFTRPLGVGAYDVAVYPASAPAPAYKAGLFMRVPIGRIVFVRDAKGRYSESAWRAATHTGLPVAAVDE